MPFGGPHSSADGNAGAQAQPFWGRLFRALFLLAIAAVAHLWLGRGPENRLAPALAIGPGQPGINAIVQTLGNTASAPTPAATSGHAAGPGVTIRTELVPVTTIGFDTPANGARPLPPAAPQPDAPAGILAVSHSDPAAPGATSTVDRSSAIGISEPATDESRREDPEPEPEAEAQPAPLAAVHRTLPDLPRAMAAPTAPPRAQVERVIHTAPIVEPDQHQMVNRVLQQYATAYERLDVAAAKEVYPSVNDTALRRAFSQLEAQSVSLGACGIIISGSGANAHCKGEAAYLPRVGPRTLHRASREWTFDLAKADDRWRIVRATVK